MGGGTGTGAAPVIARIAREMGILTVGVVTKPFEFEGRRRNEQADEGVAELESNVESLIVVLNEKLLEVLGDDVTQEDAFAHANDVLKNAVGGISDIIHIPGLVNVDFEDVKTVMSEPGKAMMGTATAAGPDRAHKAAEAAVACPLLEGIDLSGARGVLVLIAAAKSSFRLSESKNVMNTIRRYAAEDAHVIYGTAYDDALGDQLRVTVIATGLSRAGAKGHGISPGTTPPLKVVGQPQSAQGLRNGTDGLPVLTQPMGGAAAGQGMAGAGFVTSGAVQAGAPMPQGGQPTQPLQMPPPQAYEGLQTPSVWRRPRADQAAAKVEALGASGMDEIEIPAFLRKQAD
jgi:cell division protein FtsZ